MSTGYILGIARGHNAGVCLLKDGEVVFAIEEERLTRTKYDGGPYAAMIKVKEYTDKIDALIIAHTQSLENTAGRVDFTGDNIYTGIARKLGLIERKTDLHNHPQVFDISNMHHKTHAACAFYRSGFEDAVAVVVDGAGSQVNAEFNGEPLALWEVESIFDCGYPDNLKTVYKHYGCRSPIPLEINYNSPLEKLNEGEGEYIEVISGNAGITKTYEAVTEYCGFQAIEAGKTMGLFPYGELDRNIPVLFDKDTDLRLSNRNLFVPTYPNGAIVNQKAYNFLRNQEDEDLTKCENRRNMAYAVQTETQAQVLDLIRTAAKLTGKNKVVLSGGYGLNCVANYSYLETLKDDGIELYVEPISNDAGTAIGAAMLYYYSTTKSTEPSKREIYLGPDYNYTNDDIDTIAEQHGLLVSDVSDEDIVGLIREKNIVAFFQGRSENGPRALGNRSLVFDPTFEDGKDFVNEVKRREYFRPFAGSILEEDAHEWFDLRGMESSPHMMYAVNAKEGIAEKIPAIIHVDGTCRIQTVNEEDNPLYYEFIKEFKKQTGVPIVFNTSFNLGGEPLVETIDDAVWTLNNSDISYLYFPEHNKLLKKSGFKIA